MPSAWDWKDKAVTVCIAAICEFEKQPVIVCCADMQGTYGDFIKADDEHKFEHFGKYCNVLKAGTPSRAKELVAAIKPALAEFDLADKSPEDFDLRISRLLEKIRKAAREFKARIVEHYLGTNYLMSFEDYKAGRFYKDDAPKIQKEIRELDIGCELIISTNSDTEPVIIEVCSDCSVYWQGNYICIGHGQDIAMAILCQDQHYEVMPMMDCIAKVLFAKTAAEKDPTVGQSTSFVVITKDGPRALSDEAWKLFDEIIKPIHAPKNIEFKSSYLKDVREGE
jgi:20S proteasome alpha/beta subunit